MQFNANVISCKCIVCLWFCMDYVSYVRCCFSLMRYICNPVLCRDSHDNVISYIFFCFLKCPLTTFALPDTSSSWYLISLLISEYCMMMMMRQITVTITTMHLLCGLVQVFPCRHIGSHALPKMISGSQSHGAYSAGVPGSIFLMAL